MSIGVIEGFTRNNQCIDATLERLNSGRDILRMADLKYSEIEAKPAGRCLSRVHLQRRDGIADMLQHRQATEIGQEFV